MKDNLKANWIAESPNDHYGYIDNSPPIGESINSDPIDIYINNCDGFYHVYIFGDEESGQYVETYPSLLLAKINGEREYFAKRDQRTDIAQRERDE